MRFKFQEHERKALHATPIIAHEIFSFFPFVFFASLANGVCVEKLCIFEGCKHHLTITKAITMEWIFLGLVAIFILYGIITSIANWVSDRLEEKAIEKSNIKTEIQNITIALNKV